MQLKAFRALMGWLCKDWILPISLWPCCLGSGRGRVPHESMNRYGWQEDDRQELFNWHVTPRPLPHSCFVLLLNHEHLTCMDMGFLRCGNLKITCGRSSDWELDKSPGECWHEASQQHDGSLEHRWPGSEKTFRWKKLGEWFRLSSWWTYSETPVSSLKVSVYD